MMEANRPQAVASVTKNGGSKLDPKAIREQLDRILVNDRFIDSYQLSDFLRFVVEETLAGRQQEIKQYTVAVKALGYQPDFNPRETPAVRVLAHRLRRALKRYYETEGARDSIRIDIPVGSYVPTFEQTPVSIDSGQEIQEPLPTPPTTSEPQALSGYPTLAVLIFDNLSQEEEQAHFATGLTEQLIIRLARYRDLRVVGPISRQRLKNADASPEEIGQEYEARFFLSGSVRRSGQAIRVTANLTDLHTRAKVWAERFDRDLTASNLFDIEDEITEAVAAKIASGLGAIPLVLLNEARRKRTEELVAYEAYLKMRHWAVVITEEAFVQAWQALEHAVKIAPDYALTKATLANIYATDYAYGIGLVENGLDRAEPMAIEAVVLDPNNQEARWVMGFVHFLRRRREHCEKEFQVAYELNPNNAHILAIYSLFIAMLGEWECGVVGTQNAMRLNPQHVGWYPLVLCLNHYRLGAYDAALAEALRLRTPSIFWEPLCRAAVFGQLGRPEDAAPYLQQLFRLQPKFQTRGRELMRRQLYSDENVEMMLEGLYKAGLETVG